MLWRLLVERNAICGYYWSTIIGSGPRANLAATPKHLRARTDERFSAVQLSDDPENQKLTRLNIPDLRQWLRPVLPGWMIADGIAADDNLYEGLAVPTCSARMLSALEAERVSVPATLDLDLEPDVLVEGDLESCNYLNVEMIHLESGYQLGVDGLRGTVSALVRGIEEGWLEEELLSEVTIESFAGRSVRTDQGTSHTPVPTQGPRS